LGKTGKVFEGTLRLTNKKKVLKRIGTAEFFKGAGQRGQREVSCLNALPRAQNEVGRDKERKREDRKTKRPTNKDNGDFESKRTEGGGFKSKRDILDKLRRLTQNGGGGENAAKRRYRREMNKQNRTLGTHKGGGTVEKKVDS